MAYISSLHPRAPLIWPNPYRRSEIIGRLLEEMEPKFIKSIERDPDPRPNLADSTQVVDYEGKQWPIVICDEVVTPKQFMAFRKNRYDIPAFLLGKHKFIWVNEQQLQDYLPNHNYLQGSQPFPEPEIQATDDRATSMEKYRRVAFKQDAPQFRNSRFWVNYMQAQSEARKLEQQIRLKNQQKYQCTSKRRRDSVQDDDADVISITSGSRSSSLRSPLVSGKSKRSKHAGDVNLTPDDTQPNPSKIKSKHFIVDSDEEADDDNIVVTPAKTSSSKADNTAVVSSSRAPGDKLDETDRKKLSRAEASGNQNLCTIYIGAEKDSFPITASALAACPYLDSRKESNNYTGGYIIDLNTDPRAIQHKLTAKQFMPIWEYMKTGDIGPKLLQNNTAVSQLDHLPNRKKSHIELLGLTFSAAHKIQHHALQALILRKLRALYPLDPFSLLIMATILGRISELESEAEAELGTFVIDCVTEQFWALVRNHSEAVQRLFEENWDLRQGVYQRLGRDGGAGKMEF